LARFATIPRARIAETDKEQFAITVADHVHHCAPAPEVDAQKTRTL
jgi:hypothetical protein